MDKILQKRITFFTKIYLILISISVLVLIYKVDSDESREDMNYIVECMKFNEIELSDIESKGIAEDKIYTWLNTNNLELWQENKKAREALVNILIYEYGASPDNINRIKGYDYERPDYNTDKHIFNLIGIDTAYKDELIKFNKQKGEFATVEECLLKIKLLSKPFFAVIMQKLDDNDLRHSIDSIFIEPYKITEVKHEEIVNSRLRVFDRVYRLAEIGYKNGQFYINSVSGGRNPQSGGIIVPDIPIRGITKMIEINSFNTLMNLQSEYVDELINKPELFNRLQITYGKLYVEDCSKLLSEENSKSFKSISILGFQFSRKRLPFAFLFFCTLASGGIYLSTFRAKKHGSKVISNANEDDVLFMLIENKYARFFIWCISPLLVVLMNFEFEISSLTSIFQTIFILLLIMYLNIKSYIISVKL